MSHIRITRGPSSEPGGKRPAHYGKVEAIADDGTTVDVSDSVTLTQIDLKAGDIERAIITFLAFEVIDQ